MRLKSFYAKTMTEAMQMVRDTLGEDAIIVATRDEKGGKGIHVTAAIEPAFEVGRRGFASSSDEWLQYDDEDEQSAVAEEITDVMLRHAVPEDVLDHIISCATVIGLEQPGIALIAALEHLFQFRPLPQRGSAKAMMIVGPPGGGKTLAVAKIATRAVMDSLKVGVISCDTMRAGGYEQLQAFTKLLRIDLQKAASARDLAAVLPSMEGHDFVLIDTAGINPFDNEDIKSLARLTAAGPVDPYLVLPAGMDADESGEMARVFSALGVRSMISSRIDMARRLGGILSAAHYGGLAFADISVTPKVADGLSPLTPKILAGLLMPNAYKDVPLRDLKKTPMRSGTQQ